MTHTSTPQRSRLLAFALSLALLAPTAAHATTFTILNLDGAGEGFNDTTPRSPEGGNPGTTLGALRLNAFQEAANRWAAVVNSSVTILADGNFDPLTPCGGGGALLGFAGPNTVHRDFTGVPVASTWFGQAEANALHGSDLDPSTSDIAATFNSDIDNGCLPGISGWYYGFDGNAPSGKIDLIPVLLHELGHGLGFLTFVDLASGAKLSGFDDTFMRFVEDHSTGMMYPAMTNGQRVTASTNTGNLHWVGTNVAAASGLLSAGTVGTHVRLYAPNPQEPGSSVSHWDTVLTPDELMEPIDTGSLFKELTIAAYDDMGWPPLPHTTPTPTVTPTPGPTPTPGNPNPFTCYKAGATGGSVKFLGIPNPPGVSLVDQFGGPVSVEVKKPKFLCAPTDKNGEDPSAPTHPEHLKAYQIKYPTKPVLPTNIKVVDQFNPSGLFVDAKKPSHLLVPSVKSLTGPTPLPTPGAFVTDHFECYKVAVTKNTPKFIPVLGLPIGDQFGTMTVDVKKPQFLCTPVDKNGEDPSAPTDVGHLMCYQVKQVDLVKFVKLTGVFVNNQFGSETLDVKKPAQLCLPALKNP